MKLIKTSLIFAAGASVGAGAVYFFMNKKLEEERESKQLEIDQVKAAYNKKTKEEFPVVSEEPEEMNVDPSSVYAEIVEDIVNKSEEEPIEYISAEEYEANEEDMHVFLTYYKKDDVVVYADTLIPMENPEEILGEEFRYMYDDSDVIYIRNNNEGAYYELMIDTANSLSEEEEEPEAEEGD